MVASKNQRGITICFFAELGKKTRMYGTQLEIRETQMMREREIFVQVLRLETSEERDAYLAQECSGDTALHSRIQQLLEEHRRMGDFLEDSPYATAFASKEPETCDRIEDSIGPYKLLQHIGEGGMGVRYISPSKRSLFFGE